MIAGGLHQPGTGVLAWDSSIDEHALDPERLATASNGIPPVFRDTPQYRSEGLSRHLGLEVILKIETVNPAGSTAGRGAEWWFESHPDAHRIVCPSAGDFGVAMAGAGRRRGIEVDLFGPETASRITVDDLRRSGTTVQLDGHDNIEAAMEARRFASVVDAQYVDDAGQLEFVVGSATMAVELADELADTTAVFLSTDTAFVPIGVGQWLHHNVPRVRVVAVEVGGSSRAVGAANTAVDQMVHMDTEAIHNAQRALSRHEGLQVSAAGAAPLAAAQGVAPSIRGGKVIVVVGSRRLV